MSDLDVIREARDYLAGLIEGATPGPWDAYGEAIMANVGPGDCRGCSGILSPAHEPSCGWTEIAGARDVDARLIVALRAAAPLLIEALDSAIAWQEDGSMYSDDFLWASHADAARAILATKGQE